jgi:FkbM family methyltransferase
LAKKLNLKEALVGRVFRWRHLWKGVPVRMDGDVYRFDESLRRWNFEGEMPVHRALREYLRPGFIFFDIGSNFGLHAIPAAKWVTPKGQVHAFEPVSRHLLLLQRHKRLNHFGGELKIVAAAVSNEEADLVQFEVPIDTVAVEAGIKLSDSSGAVERLKVRNIRLDDYCDQLQIHPHVIKIDVEGAEFEVLKGAAEMLREHTPILIIEIHDFALPAFDATADLIKNFLGVRGYSNVEVLQAVSGSKAWHQALFKAG